MSIKKYDKLVRDKIPMIIRSTGAKCTTRIASNDDYQQKLKEKLIEEAEEFFENPCVEELADIQEVVDALSYANRWDVTRARIKKQSSNGGFYKRIILEEVQEVED